MKSTICIIPKDTIERALRGECKIVDDFTNMTYTDFIIGTICIINEVGVSSVIRPEESARSLWYRVMEDCEYLGMGSSSEEDELIAYTTFIYARYIINTFDLAKHFNGIEMMPDLNGGDIYLHG